MSGVFLTEEEIAKVKLMLDSALGTQAQLDDASRQIAQLKQDVNDLERAIELLGHDTLRSY